MKCTRFVSWLVLLVCTACGGGGGGTPAADEQVEPPIPDLAVFMVSGHQGLLNGEPSLSYLDEFFGPSLVADLRSAGYTVAFDYYVDHPVATDQGGYEDLLADLALVYNNWVVGRPNPTRLIVIAHSHGGPWATAAVRALPNIPIRLQVALDHSSYGWGTVGHDLHDAPMGGDPRDRYNIASTPTCPSDLGAWTNSSPWFDLEDVVFPNVQEAFEIQAGQIVVPVFGSEPYDDHWNVRLSGSLTDLFCLWTGTTHQEVRRDDGTTYPIVVDWILNRLATD